MKRSEEFELEFEFPVNVPRAVPNDVVFCGKLMTRGTQTEEEATRALLRSETSSGRVNGFAAWLRSPSGRETRSCRRSDSCRKRYNGVFGTAMKFPLQMELSDIKMRQQERRELPPPMATAKGDGGDSCWELVRPLRRRGTLKNVLFGCLVPIV